MHALFNSTVRFRFFFKLAGTLLKAALLACGLTFTTHHRDPYALRPIHRHFSSLLIIVVLVVAILVVVQLNLHYTHSISLVLSFFQARLVASQHPQSRTSRGCDHGNVCTPPPRMRQL